ncbi:hypothetical protein ACOZ38_23150 [Sphaerisporangium viridialbum]|uniref:hypothetical protein n=1 Tax=Sphaerisporangium viridialbum TaxID=46189 RepID=UPI003C7758A1
MRVRHYVLAIAVAGVLGGCGGGTPAAAPSSPPAPSPPASAAPTSHPTESSPPGDIPDDTVFLAYRPPDGSYEVKVPEGWARMDLATGASFTDKLNSVRVEFLKASPSPIASADIRKTEQVTRKGGTATRIVYRADSAPDPVTGKVVRDEVERYEFSRNGGVAVLTLSGPVGADNVDPWRTISDSFRWTP